MTTSSATAFLAPAKAATNHTHTHSQLVKPLVCRDSKATPACLDAFTFKICFHCQKSGGASHPSSFCKRFYRAYYVPSSVQRWLGGLENSSISILRMLLLLLVLFLLLFTHTHLLRVFFPSHQLLASQVFYCQTRLRWIFLMY